MKAIIFDFGNVVGFFDHFRTLEKLTPHTTWSARRIYDAIFDGPLEDDLESGRITVDQFLAEFRRLCELTCDSEFLRAACGDIFTPNAAVCELIPKLRGRYRIVLGSNTNPLHGAQFTRQFADVLGHFDHLVLSTRRCPKPRRRSSTSPPGRGATVFFIDDLPTTRGRGRHARAGVSPGVDSPNWRSTAVGWVEQREPTGRFGDGSRPQDCRPKRGEG